MLFSHLVQASLAGQLPRPHPSVLAIAVAFAVRLSQFVVWPRDGLHNQEKSRSGVIARNERMVRM